MLNETWKEIPKFKDYSVSNKGRIRNKEGKILTLFPRGGVNGTDYLGVDLYRLGKKYPKLVHRLVAETFIPEEKGSLRNQVNHKDMNTKNNNIDNLEWVTDRENKDHRSFMEAHKYI
jgi:hypothetical protein